MVLLSDSVPVLKVMPPDCELLTPLSTKWVMVPVAWFQPPGLFGSVLPRISVWWREMPVCTVPVVDDQAIGERGRRRVLVVEQRAVTKQRMLQVAHPALRLGQRDLRVAIRPG